MVLAFKYRPGIGIQWRLDDTIATTTALKTICHSKAGRSYAVRAGFRTRIVSETLTIVIFFSPRVVVRRVLMFWSQKKRYFGVGSALQSLKREKLSYLIVLLYFSSLFGSCWNIKKKKYVEKNKCIRACLCNYHQRRPKSVHSVVLLRMISWAAAVLLGGHGISNAVKKMARTLPIRGLKALRHVHKVFRLQVFMMEKASLYQTQHERERTCCAAIPSLHVFLRVYNRMICFF